MATSTIFSGSSRFSTDLKSVMDRSIAIASLPGDQLRRQRSTLSDEQSALTSLQTTFTGLYTAVDRLDAAFSGPRTTANVSAGGIFSTAVTDASEGTYSVSISDLGTVANEISKSTLSTVADPAVGGISNAATLTLSVGGTTRTLTPASHSLNDLAAAINANSDLNIRATIVRFGTESAPSYRLSIQSTTVGNTAITLNDGTDLLDTITAGSPMVYRLNGTTTDLTANSRTVTIAPGLKISATAVGQAEINVTKSNSPISDALNGFVSAYNSAVRALDAQHGEKAGVLSGQSVVNELGRSLRSLMSYTSSSGGLQSLTAFGLTFDDKGRLSFDASTFDTATRNHAADLTNFFGRKGETGFLLAATSMLSSVTTSTEGTLASINSSLAAQDAQISAEDDRIALLRDQLTIRMSAADSLIASLEQQVSYITGLFAAQTQKSS